MAPNTVLTFAGARNAVFTYRLNICPNSMPAPAASAKASIFDSKAVACLQFSRALSNTAAMLSTQTHEIRRQRTGKWAGTRERERPNSWLTHERRGRRGRCKCKMLQTARTSRLKTKKRRHAQPQAGNMFPRLPCSFRIDHLQQQIQAELCMQRSATAREPDNVHTAKGRERERARLAKHNAERNKRTGTRCGSLFQYPHSLRLRCCSPFSSARYDALLIHNHHFCMARFVIVSAYPSSARYNVTYDKHTSAICSAVRVHSILLSTVLCMFNSHPVGVCAVVESVVTVPST